MEIQRQSAGSLYLSVLWLLVTALFADLGALVLVLVAHAATSSVVLLRPALFLVVALGLLSFATIATGIAYAWTAYPQHRRALAIVFLVTLAVLLAHLYIINSPPASEQGVLSGPLGTQLQDQEIQVNSSLQGQALVVDVKVTGSNAIADLRVGTNGGSLQGAGFNSTPTFSFPLAPGSTVTGSWTVSAPVSQLSVSYQYLSCYSTISNSYGCIMDEVFYVPEAQGMLAGQQCSTTLPNCHMEHPFLSPALIAGGMALFGEFNTFGWRIMPVLLGTLSLPLLFGIVWKVSESKKIAYFSAILLALDVMFFAQSSAALLDIPMVFFGLLALFVYVWDVKFWKLDRYILAGIMLALSGLSKETAIFMVMAMVTYNLLLGEGGRRKRYLSTLKMVLTVALVFSAGLQTYDSLFASPAVPTFVDQLRYMLSYGSSLIANQLACAPVTGYWCKFPNNPGGAPILPTDWLIYYNPVPYYSTSVSVCLNSVNGVCQSGQYTYVGLAYYGVTNFFETWATFVWVPLAIFLLYRHSKKPQSGLDKFMPGGAGGVVAQVPGELKLAALALIWFFWTYVPYIFMLLGGRVTYPFYFIPAIPAMAIGTSFLLTRKWFPRWAAFVYVGLVFIFFFVFFPDKAFLPIWLRAAIGH